MPTTATALTFFAQPTSLVGIAVASDSPEQPPPVADRLEDKERRHASAPDMSGCNTTPFTQHPHNAGVGESAVHNSDVESLAPTTFQSQSAECSRRRGEDLIERRPRPLFDQSSLAERRRYSYTPL